MVVVLDQAGMSALTPPVVVQECRSHGAKLFKVRLAAKMGPRSYAWKTAFEFESFFCQGGVHVLFLLVFFFVKLRTRVVKQRPRAMFTLEHDVSNGSICYANLVRLRDRTGWSLTLPTTRCLARCLLSLMRDTQVALDEER